MERSKTNFQSSGHKSVQCTVISYTASIYLVATYLAYIAQHKASCIIWCIAAHCTCAVGDIDQWKWFGSRWVHKVNDNETLWCDVIVHVSSMWSMLECVGSLIHIGIEQGLCCKIFMLETT